MKVFRKASAVIFCTAFAMPILMAENWGISANAEDFETAEIYDVSENIEVMPIPQFRVKFNEYATAGRTDGTAVYTVRAKIDCNKFASWDDTEVPVVEDMGVLWDVSCSEDAETGSSAKASIEGFDKGTIYDEFELYFFKNGLYTLYVRDSKGAYSYLEMNVTEVSTDVRMEDAYEGIDRKAPGLAVEIPNLSQVAGGMAVQVRITANEPCVIQVGGEIFGTAENPVKEAIFEAFYNGEFSAVATDLDHNTTQKFFIIESFSEGDASADNGRNPYNPINRDNYWEPAEFDNNINFGSNNSYKASSLPQTGVHSKSNMKAVLFVVCGCIAVILGIAAALTKKFGKKGGVK